MTVMLTLHHGYDVGYLTGSVGAGGADYYLSSAGKGGEPPGYWAGRGAEALHLAGDVDADVMRALYHQGVGPDGQELPSSNRAHTYEGMGETLEDRIQAEIDAKVAALGKYATDREIREIRLMVAGKQRNSVPFFDFTLSMAKSISVLHASYMAAAAAARADGDDAEAARCTDAARTIEDAVRAGAEQVVQSAEHHAAYVRTGHHGTGTGQWRDAAGLTAAIFVQRTSREGDPQLHAHIAILNKAQRADGADAKYRTLDSRSLHRERLGLAARAGMVVEQELMAAGFELVQREDGNGREVGGVSAATMAAFSTRRAQVTDALKKLIDEYTATRGHEPSERVKWSMRQHAALVTRKGKESAPSVAQSLADWERRSRKAEVQMLADVQVAVREFRNRARRSGAGAPLGTADMHRAIRIAVHEVQERHATWTMSQLAWELFRAMPPRNAETLPEVLQAMLNDALTDRVEGVDIVPLAPAPDVTDVSVLGVRESDGVSVYRPPGEARYCTAGHLDVETHLIQAARRKVRQMVTDEEAADATVGGLTPNQAGVVRGLLTSETAVTLLSGPAGSGKTHVVARFAREYMRITGRRVVGLTASTNAARVLQGEGLAETYNIADFLGKIKDSDLTRGNIAVGPGDVLVVDEATQVGTADMDAIMTVAMRSGARVIPAGDQAQLGAVGAGGIMAEIGKHQGFWVLHEVRRFTAPWEARASLQLHDGDFAVWADYKMQGRVRDGVQDKAYDKAVELWAADHLRGRQSLLLAGSNAEAAELARLARKRLINYGQLTGADEITLSDGNAAGVGDLIRARLNAHIDAGGQNLTNRDTLKVTGWRGSGEKRAATVQRAGPDGWSREFTVPSAYLEENAELAYAGNVHVSQGRTVDSSHLIVSDTLDRGALYVGMTRGRDLNVAHVVTGPANAKADQELAPPEAVLAAAMNREAAEATATAVIRDAQAWSTNSRHLFELWRDLVHHEAAPRIDAAVRDRIGAAEYDRYLTDPQRPVLHEQLRTAELAGHNLDDVLDQVTARDFGGAHSIAAVLHGRTAKLDIGEGGTTRTWAERTPRRQEAGQSPPDRERDRAAQETAASLDHRQTELGLKLADQPEPWVVRYLGMPPQEAGPLREDWAERAGIAASYREAAGHDDPENAVGPYPVRNPELAEAYGATVRALEMQVEERARGVDRGTLEARVKVYEQARAWAPEPAGPALESVTQAEQDALAQAEAARARDENEMADAAENLRQILAADRDRLQVQQAAREEWLETHAEEREAAKVAEAEIDRRDAGAPEPDPVEQQIDEDADRAREAAETRAAEIEMHEAEAAQYEAERSVSDWREPELSGAELELTHDEIDLEA